MLPDYATGTIDLDERQALEAHLRDCPGCRDELARVQNFFSLLTKERHNAPSQREWNNFPVHVREGIDRKAAHPFTSPVFLRIALPATISVLLIFGALIMYQDLNFTWSDTAIREGIRNVVSNLDSTQLASIEIPIAVDPSLPDIISPVALETVAADSIDLQLVDQLFAGLTETEIVNAGSEYALPNEASPLYESADALHTIQDISSASSK